MGRGEGVRSGQIRHQGALAVLDQHGARASGNVGGLLQKDTNAIVLRAGLQSLAVAVGRTNGTEVSGGARNLKKAIAKKNRTKVN